MHDVEQRLTKCFSVVFPELSQAEIVKATPNTTRDRDSLTTVTLLALIEEEFLIELEPNGTMDNLSFDHILAQVMKALDSQIPAQSANRY